MFSNLMSHEASNCRAKKKNKSCSSKRGKVRDAILEAFHKAALNCPLLLLTKLETYSDSALKHTHLCCSPQANTL